MVSTMQKIFISGIFVCFLSIPAVPARASSAAGEIRDGNRAYKEKKYDEALEHYMRAGEKAPDSDIVHFNLGAALYKSGRYGESIDAFTKALNTEDGQLESDALYNIANAKYKLGSADADKDLKGAISLYRESLEYYRRAIELNEKNREAKFNHEVVEKDLNVLLDRLKNQPQQEEQDQDKEGEDTAENQQSPAGAEEEQKGNKEKDGKDRPSGSEEKGKEEAGEPLEQQQDSAQGEADIREMSPEEARMLLDAYGDEQAMDGTKQGTKGHDPEVLKDW